MTNIIDMNMSPLLKMIKLNLEKWRMINLTLWGKINVIKMIVTTQFNYISMMIPVQISNIILKQYNKLIRVFVEWEKIKK